MTRLVNGDDASDTAMTADKNNDFISNDDIDKGDDIMENLCNGEGKTKRFLLWSQDKRGEIGGRGDN